MQRISSAADFNCKVRIHFCDDNNSIPFLKGIVKVKNSLVIHSRQEVHLSQSRGLLLDPSGDELCGILHFH